MNICSHVVLFISILLHVCCGMDEYCLNDKFKAECNTNEVILVTTALFGRMEIGKCVTSDRGDLGCSIDALPFLDKACSHKMSCEYYVGNFELVNTNPCESDGNPYLLLDYVCIEVTQGDGPANCRVNSYTKVPASYGYLSSSTADDHGIGSLACPWRIEALPGQSVSITVISLGALVRQSSCQTLGFITDKVFRNNVTICQPDVREQHVFTSNGHVVDIQMIKDDDDDDTQHIFLLQYTVTGCADVLAPDHAWHKREGNVATVGCKHQNKTWHLLCEGSNWQGVVGSCEGNGEVTPTGPDDKWSLISTDIPPQVMILLIIAGIVLIVAICSVTIIVKFCCIHKPSAHETQPHFDAQSIPPNYGYTSSQAHEGFSWACTFKGGQQVNTHIWETPLPEPQDGEYTLPASMKKQLYPSNEISGQDIQRVPAAMTVPQYDSGAGAESTLPPNPTQVPQPEYTMPVKIKRGANPTNPGNSDYTIPVLPQPVPDTPDSESEYTMPTGVKVPNKTEREGEKESSMMRVL